MVRNLILSACVPAEIQAAGSTFGNYFRVTTFGESHGGGVGCIIDGCPPRLPLSESDMQVELDRRYFFPCPQLFFYGTNVTNTILIATSDTRINF